jgi:hypothetical protein
VITDRGTKNGGKTIFGGELQTAPAVDLFCDNPNGSPLLANGPTHDRMHVMFHVAWAWCCTVLHGNSGKETAGPGRAWFLELAAFGRRSRCI